MGRGVCVDSKGHSIKKEILGTAGGNRHVDKGGWRKWRHETSKREKERAT